MQKIAESPLSLEPGDHYGNGGVVTKLEAQIAQLLGKEAAVFMPSGTMAQQIALRIYADESGINQVAFHPTCHLHIYEQMAYSELHHLEGVLLGNPEALFTLQDLESVQGPLSSLLIELPQRVIGGQLPTWEELTAICDYARAKEIKLHMDGARLWECAPFYNRTYAEIAAPFESVYVSFYKILGALPGAALAGPASLIEKARIWQRRHGGNLHQQSPAAISAILGMEHHLPLIPRYVEKAREIASILSKFEEIEVIPKTPPTNMMHLKFGIPKEALEKAVIQIAEEDKVFFPLFLSDDCRTELTVGEAVLDFNANATEYLFSKLLNSNRIIN